MTDKQLAKIGKVINLLGLSEKPNMDIYLHNASEKEAKEIMRKLPKTFQRETHITESGNNWKDAKIDGAYGLGRFSVTVFYSKKEGGDK